MSPSRRRFLRDLGAGGAVLLAGCLGGDTGGSTTRTADPATTDTTTDRATTSPPVTDTRSAPTTTTVDPGPHAVGETVTVGGRTVTVESVAVQRQVVVPSSTHFSVVGSTDAVFVVAAIRVGEDDPGRCIQELSAALVLDGERFGLDRRCLYTYEWEERRARVAFAVPTPRTVERATVEWSADRADAGGADAGETSTVRWRLPARTRRWLARPPAPRLRTLEIPDRAAAGETVPVRIRAGNTGSRGTFRYVLDTPDVTTPLLGSVEVGTAGTAVATERFEMASVNGPLEEGVAVTLDWGIGRERRTVALAEGQSTTTDAA